MSEFWTLPKYLFLAAFGAISVLVGMGKLPLALFFIALVPMALLIRAFLRVEARTEALSSPKSS